VVSRNNNEVVGISFEKALKNASMTLQMLLATRLWG
jgi:hypothetical protein